MRRFVRGKLAHDPATLPIRAQPASGSKAILAPHLTSYQPESASWKFTRAPSVSTMSAPGPSGHVQSGRLHGTGPRRLTWVSGRCPPCREESPLAGVRANRIPDPPTRRCHLFPHKGEAHPAGVRGTKDQSRHPERPRSGASGPHPIGPIEMRPCSPADRKGPGLYGKARIACRDHHCHTYGPFGPRADALAGRGG